MATWELESGHTSAEFCVRHMMVTWIRGHLSEITGTLKFDPENPEKSSVDVTIPVKTLCSGNKPRDEHLLNKDFLDSEKHPTITFKGKEYKRIGPNEGVCSGDLTIRGVTRKVELDIHFLGQWDTPFWEDGVDKGPKARAGFVAKTKINRHDFGVSWNGTMDKGGIVVGDDVFITIDAEAIKKE